MNPFDNLYSQAMLGESMSPTLVDERGEDLMYLGYPIDSCTGVADAKWLIKRIITFTLDDGSTKRAISYAGGSRAFTQQVDRARVAQLPAHLVVRFADRR